MGILKSRAKSRGELEGRLWRTPFYGSGWKVVIIDEADRMHPAVETIWLDRLEAACAADGDRLYHQLPGQAQPPLATAAEKLAEA